MQTQLLKALAPVLKDKDRAEKILKRFWRDKMALVWTVKDVHRAANEIEIALSAKEAREVLEKLHAHYNPQYGIKWEDIQEQIKLDVLGRPMTKREVSQFVHKDIITKS